MSITIIESIIPIAMIYSNIYCSDLILYNIIYNFNIMLIILFRKINKDLCSSLFHSISLQLQVSTAVALAQPLLGSRGSNSPNIWGHLFFFCHVFRCFKICILLRGLSKISDFLMSCFFHYKHRWVVFINQFYLLIRHRAC